MRYEIDGYVFAENFHQDQVSNELPEWAIDHAPQSCADAAAANPFQVGDIVYLKSGGVAMTVAYSGVDITAQWFRGDVLDEADFEVSSLTYDPVTSPF